MRFLPNEATKQPSCRAQALAHAPSKTALAVRAVREAIAANPGRQVVDGVSDDHAWGVLSLRELRSLAYVRAMGKRAARVGKVADLVLTANHDTALDAGDVADLASLLGALLSREHESVTLTVRDTPEGGW